MALDARARESAAAVARLWVRHVFVPIVGQYPINVFAADAKSARRK